jgi:hypothetical protein
MANAVRETGPVAEVSPLVITATARPPPKIPCIAFGKSSATRSASTRTWRRDGQIRAVEA